MPLTSHSSLDPLVVPVWWRKPFPCDALLFPSSVPFYLLPLATPTSPLLFFSSCDVFFGRPACGACPHECVLSCILLTASHGPSLLLHTLTPPPHSFCEHLENLGRWDLAVLVAMHLRKNARRDLDRRYACFSADVTLALLAGPFYLVFCVVGCAVVQTPDVGEKHLAAKCSMLARHGVYLHGPHSLHHGVHV